MVRGQSESVPLAIYAKFNKLVKSSQLLSMQTNPAKLVTFDLLWLPPSKAPFVHQVWQLLLHKLFDARDSFLESFFGRTGDV
jgi:hypothetical protein